jgi:predicted dienelactone hydrolase
LATIWYPVASAPEQGWPVLVYLPGWGGTVVENHFLIGDLVSHGFVVVALRYPTGREIAAASKTGAILRAEPAGEMDFSSAEALRRTVDLGDDKVRGRARDVGRVLDRLQQLDRDPTSPFDGQLDLARIGAWGYSLGGASAAEAAWLDRRIKAVVNLDGWLFAEASTNGVPCPYLVIGDATPLPGPEALSSPDPVTRFHAMLDRQDYDRQIAGMKRHQGFLVTIDGTSHLSFSDAAVQSRLRRLSRLGNRADERALRVTASYLEAFFETCLLDRPSPLLAGAAADYPEAHLQIFGRRIDAPA